MSADGRLLATGGSSEGTAKIWDVETGKMLKSFDVGGGAVYTINFDARGKYVVTSGADKALKAIHIETGDVKVIDDTIGYVHQYEFSRDGRFMAGAVRNSIRVWDARTWKEVWKLPGNQNGSSYVTFSNDGRFLASTGADGLVRLWDLGTGKEAATLGDGTAAQGRLKFCADNRRLVVMGSDGQVHVYGPKLGGAGAAPAPAPKRVPQFEAPGEED